MDNKDFSILRETYLKNNNVLHTLKNQVTHIEDILEQQIKQLKRNCYHPKRKLNIYLLMTLTGQATIINVNFV